MLWRGWFIPVLPALSTCRTKYDHSCTQEVMKIFLKNEAYKSLIVTSKTTTKEVSQIYLEKRFPFMTNVPLDM